MTPHPLLGRERFVEEWLDKHEHGGGAGRVRSAQWVETLAKKL